MQEQVAKEEKKWLSLYKPTLNSEKHITAREILRETQKETNDVRIFLRNLGLKSKRERGTYIKHEKKET